MILSALDTMLFPANYAVGRKNVLEKLAGLPEPVQYFPYQCAGIGPEDEALITDTAWIGSLSASKVVVLISGTHGIEGFAGTAITLDCLGLLSSRLQALPADTAVLMVHALTPWGYAWQRRCDADGVDLNRNYVDFSKPLPENPGYELLKPAFYEFDVQQRQQAFADFEQQHGRDAFEIAISGGQYQDPDGPFYGGLAPAHGQLVCLDLIQRYALSECDLAVIDLHTGLGPYGYGEVICDHTPESSGSAVASRWYGASVTLPLLGTSSSVPKTGLLDYVWHEVMNARSCYITLEFGTFRTHELFEILLEDHLLWRRADENKAACLAHSKVMRQHFCPNEQAWREMVLFRGRQVITQALSGISS